MLVYQAILPSGKSYIGCTSRKLSDRIKDHKCKALTKNLKLPFHNAIRKYGFDSIKWNILFESENHTDILNKEIEFIAQYNTLTPNGYNITAGGEGTLGSKHNLGIKRTEEQKLVQRELKKVNGKKCVLIDIENKTCTIFDTVAELSRTKNINYNSAKMALSKNQCYYNFKIISLDKFDINDPELFKTKIGHANPFKVTNGQEVIEFPSIRQFMLRFNISERAARNVYFKNHEINGWRRLNA